MNTGALHIERIRAGLGTRRIGRRIEYLESTTSTNDEVWRRIDSDEADELVVFAEHQSAGRGRLGRKWHSPRGASLLCSVALIENDHTTGRSDNPLTGGDLVLLTAVAACDAIKAGTGVTPIIKWPNDLMVSGRKVGGILIESRRRRDGRTAYVVGIGINCLQQREHLESVPGVSATSLEIESNVPVDRTRLAISLLSELDQWLAEPRGWDAGQLRTRWLARAQPMGHRVCVQHGGRVFAGSMVGLDPGAALVVQLDEGGIRAFDAATTTIMQPVTPADASGAVSKPA